MATHAPLFPLPVRSKTSHSIGTKKLFEETGCKLEELMLLMDNAAASALAQGQGKHAWTKPWTSGYEYAPERGVQHSAASAELLADMMKALALGRHQGLVHQVGVEELT